jgi:hypothetical protein
MKISKRNYVVTAIIAVVAPLFVSIPAQATNDLQAICIVGSSSSCPAQSPQEIFNLYGTTSNGSYWLNVNGTARETFLILDTSFPDGGMWFLGMKAPKLSTTFNYNSTQWTDQTTTTGTTSLSNDVSSDAKFQAFNYLPVTKVVAVFKDRETDVNWQQFNASGSGDLGTNSFGGHTWMETITAQSMYTRFTTNQNLIDASGGQSTYMTRNTLTRETNSSSGKLVFPYQTGWSRYGFNNNSGYAYRWGVTYNNETNNGSNDTGSGIGMEEYSAAARISFSDNFAFGTKNSSGAQNPGTNYKSSGFQIWGKMATPSMASARSLSVTQASPTSVTASWLPPSSGTTNEYVLQYKLSSGNWSSATTRLVQSVDSSPSVIIPGLTAGTYDYRVWARNTTSNLSSASPVTLSSNTLDATAPTFISSSSFSAAENMATSETAATIRISESATVTISSGADAARFNISQSETNTAIIKFNSSPDFEAPADSGGNNVYDLTLTATDASGNAGTQSITITVTDVVDTSSFSGFGLPSSATTASFRTPITISAIVTVSAKVTFRLNGVVLPGCKNRTAIGSGSTFTATCSWRPSRRGDVTLTAAATPISGAVSSSSAAPLSIRVSNRSGARVA